MAGNRKAAIAQLVSDLEDILPGGGNKELYEQCFAKMSDKEFDEFMKKIESGEQLLALIAPTNTKIKLNMRRMLRLAERWGQPLRERVWIEPGAGLPRYLSNKKYLIMRKVIRRQGQLLEDKISIPKNSNTIDEMTGQPVGESKGAGISFPEMNILSSTGMDKSLEELISVRGGNIKAYQLMNAIIDNTGEVSLAELKITGTRAEAIENTNMLLTCMHLGNNM